MDSTVQLGGENNLIISQVNSLLNSEEPVLGNLANITAFLKQNFEKISWVGFYILKGNVLFLGPFQGLSACTRIEMGVGVCGTAASKKQTIIVNDVHEFPGHIACDSGSNSEIVIPVFGGNELFGVLDLDSYQYAAFNESDKILLETICRLIDTNLDLSKFVLS